MAEDDLNENQDAGGEGDEDDEDAPKGKKKLLIIIIAVVLLLAIGAGVFFSGILGGDEEPADAEHAEEAAGEGDEHAKEPMLDENGNPIVAQPAYYEMPEFLVNLSTTGQRVSFLKMKVTLELSGPEAIAVMDANKPRIKDAFNTYLRELRPGDLSGSAGIYRLREELLTRINKTVHPEQVSDILFDEIIVQ